MSHHVINMSEYVISHRRQDILITYSLGSCLAVAIYDPHMPIAGLMHAMLPDSQLHEEKAVTRPCMFINTGVPFLIDELLSRGAMADRLVIKAAGGSCMIQDSNAFRIGERNREALYNVLSARHLSVNAESVGGHHSRAVHLAVGTGELVVTTQGKELHL